MMREDVNILMYAEENVPIEENESSMDAIRIAASRYRSIKISGSLPAAYKQYRMNLALGITFPEKEGSRRNADSIMTLYCPAGSCLVSRKILIIDCYVPVCGSFHEKRILPLHPLFASFYGHSHSYHFHRTGFLHL